MGNRSLALIAALLLLLPLPLLADTIVTVAGTGQQGNNGVAAPLLTNINQPFGVEVDSAGNLYITEVGHHRLWKLPPQGEQLEVIAGTGQAGYSGDQGPATEAELNEPYEVRLDGDGNLYFVEMKNHIVRRLDAATGKLETIAGTGQAGYGGDGGPATRAPLRQPHSIALDGSGSLYIADIGNHRIRRVDLQTGRIESIAGNGERQLPVDGQLARDQPVLGPRALYVQGHDLWVALREGNSVWRLDLRRGRWHHVAGTGSAGYAGDGDDARNAQFRGPKGIAVDSQGNAFVVDTENQVIRKIDQEGQITTIAGRGPAFRGYDGDDRPARQASLNRPHGICVDSQGNVYIGDSENHRVRMIRRP